MKSSVAIRPDTGPSHDDTSLDWIDVKECSECSGLSVSTIRRLIKRGLLTIRQFGRGSAIRILATDCTTPTTSARSRAPGQSDLAQKKLENVLTVKKMPGPKPRWMNAPRGGPDRN